MYRITLFEYYIFTEQIGLELKSIAYIRKEFVSNSFQHIKYPD
jgi:hypothetical protein